MAVSYSLETKALTISGDDVGRLCRITAFSNSEESNEWLCNISDAIARERLQKNDPTFSDDLTPEEMAETRERLGAS